MPHITLPSGKSFDANVGESLVDAGLRAGVLLPHSCRSGRCSTCRCRVAAGATDALHAELGLTADELAAGWILGCVRTAISDVALDVEDYGDVVLPTARTLPCRIHTLERLSEDVMHIVLRLPPTAAFTYLPGQYVDIIGPVGMRRSYSIANAPRPDQHLEFHVRRLDGGAMSEHWFERARVNDLLRLNGPLGTFFMRETADLDLVFLATGTGIAPVKAMLEALAVRAESDRPRSLTVYWGGRKPADLYWRPGTDAPAGLRFLPALSRDEPQWEGLRGHVQECLMADKPDLARTIVYACGSDTMIHAAHSRLVAAGLPERRFNSDAFVRSGAY